MATSPSQSVLPALSPSGDRPYAKRVRLSVACNQCRKRKVRCDTGQPKCNNCILRGEECETTDLRNPEKEGSVRRLASKYAPEVAGIESQTAASPAVDDVDLSHASSSTRTEAGISWLARAYHVSTVGTEPLSGSTPDVVMNTDDTSHRVKFVGGSSLQCLCIFVDLHLVAKGLEPTNRHFRHGMRQSEEFALPLISPLPDFPPPQELEGYLDTFFDRIWPLFPVVDRDVLQAEIDGFTSIHSSSSGCSLAEQVVSSNIPGLATIYVVIGLGAAEMAGGMSDLSNRFISATYGLFAHLVAMPYANSVRAIFLLSVALKGQAKDGQAWNVLGQAIRIAHSIGLHETAHTRAQARSTTSTAADSADQRLWWSCYAFEKLMQLESGRPSIINDTDEANLSLTPPVATGFEYFDAWVSLARLLGQICDQIYTKKPKSSLDLFLKIARLDKALVRWDKSLPDHLRPGHDSLHTSELEASDQHLASFLSLQYHQAQITLLRVSLVFPHASYTSEVRKHAAAIPTWRRLSGAAGICTTAARAMATRALQLADHGVRSVLLGATAPFLASVVLAVHVLRQPGTRLARADLELFGLATDQLRDHYARWVPGAAFVDAGAALRQRLDAIMRPHGGGAAAAVAAGGAAGADFPPYQQATTIIRTSSPELGAGRRRRSTLDVAPSSSRAGVLTTLEDGYHAAPGIASTPNAISRLPSDPFEHLPLDELWNIVGFEFQTEDYQMLMPDSPI